MTIDNLVKMRASDWHKQHCESLAIAPPRIDTLAFVWLDEVADGLALSTLLQSSERTAATENVTRLHPSCPMFARKFPDLAAKEVMHLLMQPPMRVVARNISLAVELYNEIAVPY